ncbi:TIGR04086 family membrane protein [[Clostridium] polysaccharolyticum]|uniref:Putative membrane protein, TIGR04086 family n=1 Tax=[Clostridium] polysaccharolyticum TaxID=29364 RepID=A0A1I0DMZ6_9FIRM|nr:TIGR04086 family membrane protein [[Clostridium] polysaccharolyticum]SET33477.1 putative membrane protein, TIGR04086 family [[Clostridium] polysaccharolyticum]
MNQSAQKQSKGTVLAKALFVSYVITGVVLLCLALIMYKAEPSNMFVSAGVVFAYIFSAFVGGMIVGKKTQEKRFLWGILSGVLYFSIIFAISILMKKDILSQIGSTITVFITCGFGGMLGGMLS